MFTYINIIQDYVVSDRLHEPARDIAGIVSGHDAALREADEGGEEEDAQPDGERAEQRVHVDGFGTGDRLPHLAAT